MAPRNKQVAELMRNREGERNANRQGLPHNGLNEAQGSSNHSGSSNQNGNEEG